jgi:hypothetical protein
MVTSEKGERKEKITIKKTSQISYERNRMQTEFRHRYWQTLRGTRERGGKGTKK